MAFSESEVFEEEFPPVQWRRVNDYRKAGKFLDVTIQVEGYARIKAHKAVLADRVPALASQLREKRRLKLPTVPRSVSNDFLDYVYTGRITLTNYNVKPITQLAQTLNIPVLVDWGVNFMASRLTVENVTEILHFAKTAHLESLREQCMRFITHGSDEGLALRSRAIPVAFNEPRDTFFLFGSETEDRSKYCVLQYDTRQQQQPMRRIADWEEPCMDATFSVIGESIFIVGGWSEGIGHLVRVSEFVVRAARWRKRAPLAVGRRWHATAVLQACGGAGKTLLGVFGGEGDGQRNLSTCDVYNVRRDKWSSLPSMREERYAPAAACLPGDCRVFVFGGRWNCASVEFCSLAEKWTRKAKRMVTRDFWQAAAPMRRACEWLAATAFRGGFVVAGGRDGGVLNTVELFSPPDAASPRGQWTALADMQTPRVEFSLCTSVRDDELNNTIEEFTPAAASAEARTDLTSWRWSSRNPIEMLYWIAGAAKLRL